MLNNNIFPVSLFSVGADAKTVKGEKIGYLTGILYLAPSDISGYEVCPMAVKAGCKSACLYTAGKGLLNSVQQSRIRKTKLFFERREDFMHKLVSDINKLVRKAEKQNLTPLVRLNGTSDIRWENIAFEYNGIKYRNIMSMFPNVQFYDYTKIPNRRNLPENYDLTFSYSGVKSFEKYNDIAIANNERIAVVFRKAKDIPESFKGIDVLSGDNSDVRHIEPKAVIVALYAKGFGRKDKTGFVVDVAQ